MKLVSKKTRASNIKIIPTTPSVIPVKYRMPNTIARRMRIILSVFPMFVFMMSWIHRKDTIKKNTRNVTYITFTYWVSNSIFPRCNFNILFFSNCCSILVMTSRVELNSLANSS